MRIIAGKYRGRTIKSPSNSKTRPTSDRLRETLFNILQSDVDRKTRFLDLCAGTGAVGIEAISRGADFAAFVDVSRLACTLMEENLKILGISKTKAEVFCSSAENFISREGTGLWNIVYFDPPYQSDYLSFLSIFAANTHELLAENGLLIIEHHGKNSMPGICGEIKRYRLLKQGETHLSFYKAV